MVVIRLTRVGKKKQAHYRIVAAESKRAVQGKFISILGWYNPHTKELEIKKDELKSWLDKGAQPSNTLAKLLKARDIDLPKWVKIVEKKKAPRKVVEEKKEAKPVAPTSDVADAKAEESAEVIEDVKEESSEATSDVVEEVKEEDAEETLAENSEPEAAEEVVERAEESKGEESKS